MNDQWLQDYALLALRINKVMQLRTELPYVDGYYGPTEWKAIVDDEPEIPATDLVKAAMILADSLTVQDFEAQRAMHLAKQVVAMETVCRKLSSEPLSLEEEMHGYFDIHPAWIPEAQLECALAMYDAALPGKGILATRLHEWCKQYQLPPKHHEQFLHIAEQILAEVHLRTESFLDLPEGECVEIQTVSDKPFGAATYYQGNYRTLIEINTDETINILALVDDLCHEGYPGHHTEFVLKEQHLYRKLGYVEQAVPIVLSPGCLVSEGIATHACDMIFALGELEQWLARHIYPQLNLHPDVVDLTTLRTAGDLLNGVWCNAVFMLREGRPATEVQDYLTKYMQPIDMVEHLKMPFHDVYVCTYYYAKQLLLPWLQGTDRRKMFRRFLTEQTYPTDLAQP